MLNVFFPFLDGGASRITVAGVRSAASTSAQDTIGYFKTGTAAGFDNIHTRSMPAVVPTFILDRHRDLALSVLADRRTVQLKVTENQPDAGRVFKCLECSRDRPVTMRRLGYLPAILVKQCNYGRCRLIGVGAATGIE